MPGRAAGNKFRLAEGGGWRRGESTHHMLGGNPSGGPGALKVEASGDAIDIQ